MDRKDFFSKIFLGGTMLVFAPALLNSCGTSTPAGTTGLGSMDLTASTNAALKIVGGFVYTGTLTVIRTSTSTYAAVSRICTYNSCNVEYNETTQQFLCPCHGCLYSIKGSVIQGPATKALTVYKATLSGTTLTIS